MIYNSISFGKKFKTFEQKSVFSKFKFTKDTYMFVTPQFIKQYSGDLIAGMDDPQFEELTKKMTSFLDKGSSTTTNTKSSTEDN